ncbi:MAG: hypothetical protein ACP5QR_05190 [Rhizomicrobium sp.]
MSIPFMRGYPNGKIVVSDIVRPEEVQTAADRFMAAGGFYCCEILTSGLVNLSAMLKDGLKLRECASAQAFNGPELPQAVDRLVRQSAEGMVQ